MAKYQKKAETKAKARVEMLDKLLEDIDAEVLLAGTLGATAAYGGMMPPFTRMLVAISGGEGSEKINELVLDYKTLLLAGTGAGIGGALFYNMFKRILSQDPGAEPTEQQKKEIAMTAVMASGFFEGMLMMRFASNPEVQHAIIEKMTGAGAGAAALLAKL